MPDAALPLGGARAPGRTSVTELPPPGMIALRGDLAALSEAIAGAADCPVPGVRAIAGQGARRLAWMSPDEFLLILPRAELGATLGALGSALAGRHHLALDVSDMRAMFRIEGPGAREALAKLVPADLHPDAFAEGELRRTRLAQVPCAFWLEEDGFRLVCFRSVARYAFDLLAQAADDAAAVTLFPAR